MGVRKGPGSTRTAVSMREISHLGGQFAAARRGTISMSPGAEDHLPPRWSSRQSSRHGSMPREVATVKRLLIVADNTFAAQSIRLALRQTAGFQVIGFVDGMVPVSTRAAELLPDVVAIDDMQEPEHALARLRELAALVPDAKRVFLTLRMAEETFEQVFAAGADAVISKTAHPVSLGTLLREISRDAVVHMPRRGVRQKAS